MTRFTHRRKVTTDSPIVRVAFEVAEKAHEGQGRGKGGLPYIVHPIMLYDLMKHFGETDQLTLAVALLHDAKEDHKRYQENPQAMREDLERKLKKAGVRDAAEIAHYLDDMCTELTNAAVMYEGKRTWQVEHVGKISMRSAKVKIFDQMASVLDNILTAEDPGSHKGNRWSQSWSYKALDVVKATAEERPQLAFLRDMFKVLFKYNMKLLDADEATAAKLRRDFSFDRAVQEAHRLNTQKTFELPTTDTLRFSRADALTKGIVEVRFAADGRITYYAILVNPQADRDDARNSASAHVMGAIEASKVDRRVTIGAREVLDGRMVRVNKIKPPMDAHEFIALATKHQALDPSFVEEIQERSGALASEVARSSIDLVAGRDASAFLEAAKAAQSIRGTMDAGGIAADNHAAPPPIADGREPHPGTGVVQGKPKGRQPVRPHLPKGRP